MIIPTAITRSATGFIISISMHRMVLFKHKPFNSDKIKLILSARWRNGMKKKLFSICLTATMVLVLTFSLSCINTFAVSNPFSGGEGTADNPYIIETVDQLEAVQFYRSSCFILKNDLTFNDSLFEEGGEFYNGGKGWTPIGKTFNDPFTGIFDGNGKTIKGLKTWSDLEAIGLFGYVSGTVKNLKLSEVIVSGANTSDTGQCGAIIGYLTGGRLINCSVLSGSIQTSWQWGISGGLVGILNHEGSIICSNNSANVTSNNYYAGGIAGSCGGNGGTIRECFNDGIIDGGEAGGIVGSMGGLSLWNCYNSGSVHGSETAGGMNGGAGNYNYINNFYNIGSISGEKNVGSLCGNHFSGEYTNCYSNANYNKGSLSMDGELIQQEFFSMPESFRGFDFDSIWIMSNNGPMLRSSGQDILEHKLILHPAVEPTCTEKGNNEYYICDYCGTAFKSDKNTITTENEEVIPPKGHQLEKHEEVAPTCTADGNYEYYTCANCDIAYKADGVTETLPKFEIWKSGGHSWNEEYTIDKQATCIEDGLQSIHCAKCDEIKETEVIPATGHKWNDEYTVDKEETCTEEGSKSKHCSVCNAIDESTVEAIPKADHKYGDWKVTKEATCTEDGSKEKVCEVCGDKVTEVIPATGHKWNDEYTVDKEATCTEEGSKSKHCSKCNEVTEITAISALGHEWDGGCITTEPTCTEEGVKTFTCTRCKDTRTETVEAKGHSFSDEFTVDLEPSCTEAGSKSKHCQNCDEVTEVTSIPAKGHTFGEWVEVTASTCENSGLRQRTCEICKTVESENLDPNGHDFEEDFTVDKAATCTEDGSQSIHCKNCDAVIDSQVIPAAGHTYGDWTTTKEAGCETVGSKEKSCSVCGDNVTEEIPALGHAWNEQPTIDKAATCTATGLQSIHCARCNETKDNEVIPALGHDWSNTPTVDKVATCTEDGKESTHCTRCDAVKEGSEKVVPKTGHKFSAWKTTKVATEIAAGHKTRTCSVCSHSEKQTISMLKPTLPAVKITTPKAAKKAATIKWKKISKANQKKIASIQVQYSLDKTFETGVKTVTAKKTATSKKITKLKSKKTYYVRIRTYRKSGGAVHVSKWSTVKKVKAK